MFKLVHYIQRILRQNNDNRKFVNFKSKSGICTVLTFERPEAVGTVTACPAQAVVNPVTVRSIGREPSCC